MALSQWDMKYLNADQQAEVLNYQNQWASDPNQRDSLHSVVEGIRGQAGYSGGVDGSQYIPIEGFRPPTAPAIGDFNSSMSGEWAGIIDKMKNPEPAPDYYMNLMNQQLSDIMNRPKFEYNADEDPAYQAFLQRAGRAGDKAYADNLGGMSAMTGGRPNSWAGTVASQARNAYTLQAQEAVIQFEDRAYSRYQNETQDMYNLLGALGAADDREYSRYRDGIQDNKDFADMIFKLEDREFEQFKFKTDQNWRVFDYEYQSYNDALSFKKDKISEAIDRTNLQGFVNNTDAITLGVPVGTLSQSARERAAQMEDYITKQELDINNFRKEMEIRHEFDKKLIAVKESYNTNSGGGDGVVEGNSNFIPDNTETNRINSESKKFTDLVNSDEFKRMTREQKFNAIGSLREDIVASAKSNLYGKNSMSIADLILNKIQTSSAYKQYYINYKSEGEIKQQIKQATKPGGLLDALMRNK